ncbi:FecCD family ABC transporter permease [Gordonibacter massiliensis (ex Traore et al. 2017)]|uniref:FecCD family ABC transporter permease n=1 Tax=Gordonibacter massiliensis (ex Traore et al. 2017) TaxID=1841863 RepID=UPI001C8C44E9|nr:iron ABC transporter permease [Gordonibacter massiliensis (ex Traore et al. 2017)]
MEDVLSDDAAESGSFEPVSAARRRKGARTGAARERAVMAGLAVALVALVAVSLTVGTYDVSLPEMGRVLWDWLTGSSTAHDKATVVLLTIRAPRILLAALVGAALAASGAAYQGMFRNPMVSPDILGVSNGAAVGAALALLLGLPSLVVHGLSFVCGLGAVLLVMAVARAVGKGGNTLTLMILAGVVMSSTFSALLSLVKYVADPDDALPQITYWLMGSFARSGNDVNVLVLAAILVVGGGALLLMRWRINALSFGEEEARTLGVDVKRTRTVVILAATLLTSATVCLCGTIGWVGLIIPHIVRLVVGPNFRALLPVSLLGGACFMLLVDDVARIIVPGELPVGVLTALIGAPLFIYMLVKGRKEWL